MQIPTFSTSRNKSNELPTPSCDTSQQLTQFQSMKEIASSEINVQKLSHRPSTTIDKEKFILSGGILV